ncbi:MAG TPA: hypothetical protein VK302_06850 [Terriglobales bacterium]|nr:hypothetical protein [Terriglobales bacterium]
MTAIAFCYTKPGFVIAADGLSRTLDSATGTYHPNGDKHQKVYPLLGSGRILAYAMMGEAVASEDNSFDLKAEIERQQKRLATKHFPNLRDYLGAISIKLKKTYEKATETYLDYRPQPDARNEYDRLLARLIVVGYVAAKPSCVQAELFFEDKGKVGLRVTAEALHPGIPALAAPRDIPGIIDRDPRFSEYRLPHGPEMPIEHASAVIKRRIEACASPLAAKIEPLCAGIGGHIHIAAVTPSGFKWVVPPEPPL